MNKLRLLGGVLLFMLIGVGFAYVIGTGFLSFWRGYNGQALDWLAILREYPGLKHDDPRAFQILNLILGACIILSLLFAAKVLTENLTTFGRTHWQKHRELKANKFFDTPGRGFVVAKAGPSKSKAQFLSSSTWPHCLMVAPTGAGKGISFVIPNLLLFKGSAVVLDVKGENFELTSRHRQAQGDNHDAPRNSCTSTITQFHCNIAGNPQQQITSGLDHHHPGTIWHGNGGHRQRLFRWIG